MYKGTYQTKGRDYSYLFNDGKFNSWEKNITTTSNRHNVHWPFMEQEVASTWSWNGKEEIILLLRSQNVWLTVQWKQLLMVTTFTSWQIYTFTLTILAPLPGPNCSMAPIEGPPWLWSTISSPSLVVIVMGKQLTHCSASLGGLEWQGGLSCCLPCGHANQTMISKFPLHCNYSNCGWRSGKWACPGSNWSDEYRESPVVHCYWFTRANAHRFIKLRTNDQIYVIGRCNKQLHETHET